MYVYLLFHLFLWIVEFVIEYVFNFNSEYMRYREQYVPEGLTEWTVVAMQSNQQQDGDSCGVFTCMVCIAWSMIS